MLDSECRERTEMAESERRGVLMGGWVEQDRTELSAGTQEQHQGCPAFLPHNNGALTLLSFSKSSSSVCLCHCAVLDGTKLL